MKALFFLTPIVGILGFAVFVLLFVDRTNAATNLLWGLVIGLVFGFLQGWIGGYASNNTIQNEEDKDVEGLVEKLHRLTKGAK